MKHHPYGIIDPFLRVDIADRILDEFFLIARRLKIKAFLVYGLCLGFVRDGGYIKGDNDLDVGVICNKEKEDQLISSLKENGFNRGRSFRHNNTHFYKSNILVDVYFRKSGKFYSNLDSTRYKEKEYPVPSPIEEYLSACYSNWKIKERQATHYHS